MTASKRVIRLLLIVGGIIFLGTILPTILHIPRPPNLSKSFKLPAAPNTVKTAVDKTPSGAKNQWLAELLDSLINRFPDSAVVVEGTPQDTPFIYFPRGKPMEEYVLEIFRLCRKQKIEVLEGRVKDTRANSAGLVLEKNKNRQNIVCKHRAKTYFPGYAEIAVIITGLDAVKQKDLVLLAGLKWRKSLVVNPFTKNQALHFFARAAEEDEILLKLPLEPAAYPYKNPGKGTLMIHHSEKEIAELLAEKLTFLPNSKGFATAYGSRAIENRELLWNVFRFCTTHQMAFLDLTGSQRSLSAQTAREAGILCRKSKEIKKLNNIPSMLSSAIHNAKSMGESLLVLQYSQSGIGKLDKLISNATQGDNSLKFVSFSELVVY